VSAGGLCKGMLLLLLLLIIIIIIIIIIIWGSPRLRQVLMSTQSTGRF